VSSIGAVAGRLGLGALIRVEDWLIAGWVAVVSPVLFRSGGGKGPFDPDQPLEGALRLAAVGAVLVCVTAKRRPDPAAAAAKRPFVTTAAVGPFVGGLLLVTITGFVALDVASALVTTCLVAAAAALVVVRVIVPPLGLPVRRALMTPFVMVASGMYWTLIGSVVLPGDAPALRRAAQLDPHGMLLPLGFLVAFSVVFYAMLVYAPRQAAEPEGAPAVWVLRYLAFAASAALGIGWLSVLSG